MSWSRLDDDMHDNPKLRRLSHGAFRLYWLAVSWCRRNQTGGRITAEDARGLCGYHRIAAPRQRVAELLEVPKGHEFGCWEPTEIDDAWLIHGFEERNPLTSKERTRRYRERRSGDAAVTSRVTSRDAAARTPATGIPPNPTTGSDIPDDYPTTSTHPPSVGAPLPGSETAPSEGNGMLKNNPSAPRGGISPEAQIVLAGYEKLVGHASSAVDVGRAEDYVMSLQHRLNPPAIVTRMEAHVAYCKQNHLPTPRTLAGFWDTLRRESEHQADVIGHTGVSKRSA